MCDTACISFTAINLSRDEIKGKRVIEVGSYDENGSLGPLIKSFAPAEYIGVDLKEGAGVDMICRAEDIVDKFGKESFDIVIATELLEHIEDWRGVISNIKNICRTDGLILISTRSHGFIYHGFPYDYWRYEVSDLEYIFSDCLIEKIEKDRYAPGVLLKVKKPKTFKEKDLSDYELYSIVLDKKIKRVEEKDSRGFQKRYLRRQGIVQKISRVQKFVFKIGRFFLNKFF